MRRRWLAPVPLLLLAACAADRAPQATDDHELSDALAGRVAGAPRRCLDNSQMTNVRIIAPDTIIYSATQKTVYRNTIAGCVSLRPLSTIIARQYGSQICENDTFRVREPSMSIPSGFCRFGLFVPYTKPDAH